MPVYADLTTANLEIVDRLTNLYATHIGEKKGELNQATSEFEDIGHDYRFVRGLIVTLDRRCRLETRTSVNPIDTRRRLFQIAADRGIPTTEEERSAIFSLVAKELNVTVDELHESLYGDLEDEMIVANFDPINPVDLLQQYNLSLTQTLLFNASELTFTASGNWQQIFRQIKWLGLIYSVSMGDPDYWVKVDGPTSLFKLTKRYGTSLAKLVPLIVNSTSWQVTAKVLGRRDKKRLLDVKLDSVRHGRYLKGVVEAEIFDSSVEEDFATQFKIVVKDWKLVREPGFLPVGRHVMIPDFLLKKGGMEVYMEVVGFWTPEYLENKIQKLKLVGDIDMIVAVDRRLACERLMVKDSRFNVIFYKGKIPLQPVLAHLKAKEQEAIKKEVGSLRLKELILTVPIADSRDIANMYEVSKEAVEKMIDQLHVAEYRKLGHMFVKEDLLDAIDETLIQRLAKGTLHYSEATKLIESLGGRNASTILEALGYQILWRGISPETAEVRKK